MIFRAGSDDGLAERRSTPRMSVPLSLLDDLEYSELWSENTGSSF